MKHIRKPNWIRSVMPAGQDYKSIRDDLKKKGLFTVCEEASCPNLGECWKDKTATIMILGGTCTRACKFCDVKTGNPNKLIDEKEISNASDIIDHMKLRYLVITSVDRDDLDDHGSGHFQNVVDRIAKDHPDVKVEVLVPDFKATPEFMDKVIKSNPFVIAHNVEVVKRLSPSVRDKRASYEQSLEALLYYKTQAPDIATKTSLMVGVGESWDEIIEAMDDIRNAKVDIITFGQYLMPSKKHLAVEKYYTPEEFEKLKTIAYEKGFKFVASGPMVRSSYKAAEYLEFINGLKK